MKIINPNKIEFPIIVNNIKEFKKITSKINALGYVVYGVPILSLEIPIELYQHNNTKNIYWRYHEQEVNS